MTTDYYSIIDIDDDQFAVTCHDGTHDERFASIAEAEAFIAGLEAEYDGALTTEAQADIEVIYD